MVRDGLLCQVGQCARLKQGNASKNKNQRLFSPILTKKEAVNSKFNITNNFVIIDRLFNGPLESAQTLKTRVNPHPLPKSTKKPATINQGQHQQGRQGQPGLMATQSKPARPLVARQAQEKECYDSASKFQPRASP